jgi:hypothetical protein
MVRQGMVSPTVLSLAAQLAEGEDEVLSLAFTDDYYGFVLLKGTGHVLMTAETYAVGDQLQILNTGTALVVDGSTGSTAYSVNSCGLCKEAGSTAAARDVYLYGIHAVVATS